MKQEPTAKVQALAQHLHLCIQARRLTLRSVERELGMGVGYLGQLLHGNVDLKVKHLMAVLEAIGIEPEELFSSLYAGTLPAVLTPVPGAPTAGPPRFDLGGLPARRSGEVVPGVSRERLEDAIDQCLLRLGYGPPQEEAEREKSDPKAHRRSIKRGR